MDKNSEEFNKLLVERFLVIPSFEIYGGVSGFYDYGPIGCAIRKNVIDIWRRHFVLEDEVLEIDCPTMMPEEVLKTSGHVDRFTDWMVKDLKTGECFRADHLIEDKLKEYLEKNRNKLNDDDISRIERDIDLVDNLCTKDALNFKIKEYNIRSYNDNELGEPYQFNLMFNTSIGPTGYKTGYMRPETAQGMFINFKRLYDFAGNDLPFGVAQIGRAFRNEIAPRQGLLRVREFDLAEIEFFCDPNNKNLEKFNNVKNLKMKFLSRESQNGSREIEEITIGESVNKKMVANETLGYFMARTQQFLVLCGLDPEKIRFRQHMLNEMAHYASDCWDAEALTSYGWIELVGHADRSAYDLTVHSNKTGYDLKAIEKLEIPYEETKYVFQPNRKIMGSTFKKDVNKIISYLSSLDELKAKEINNELSTNGIYELEIEGIKYEITNEMCKWDNIIEKVSTKSFVPHVIEPAYGIGRIIYTLLEHSFYVRNEEVNEENNGKKRTVLRLPYKISPYIVSVLPLSKHDNLIGRAKEIHNLLIESGISSKIDSSNASIGRRYARSDEIGISLNITIDFDTLKDDSVTIRNRDDMSQIRIHKNELINEIKRMVKIN